MRTIINQVFQTLNNVHQCWQLLTMFCSIPKYKLFQSLYTSQNVTKQEPIVPSENLSKFKHLLNTSSVNENLVPLKAFKPCPDYSWVNVALCFRCQKLEQMQLKLKYLKYIFSNHLFKKSSDVATPVQLKPRECPTLFVAAYVGFVVSRDQKGGFIYP